MSLKSVHITNAWHSTSGGIAVFYRALLEAAERHRHFMRLIVPGETDQVEETGEYGRIYHVKAPAAPLNPEYRMMFPPLYLRADGPIPRILQQERPDLVEINDKYTMPYLGGLLRVRKLKAVDWRPTVVGLTCERMDENMVAYLNKGRVAAQFVRWYMKNIYFPLFDHHIANSDHTLGELRQASRGHKVSRGVWLGHMGADFTRFASTSRNQERRTDLLRAIGAPDDSILLLYAGRLVREKNLSLAIEMMAKLRSQAGPPFHLLLAGSGDVREELAAQAAALAPGRVHFLGHIAGREALADLYAQVDTFVHTNPKEPFGIAPLEAMASGLPLVAPNSGGITSYANQENAWLCSPTAKDFAEAVCAVASDSESRRRKITAAHTTASSFTWEAATDRFIAMYADIHALTQRTRTDPGIPPAFYSTPGDYWGREAQISSNPEPVPKPVGRIAEPTGTR